MNSFEQIHDAIKRRGDRMSLLTGNGFSIAADPSFDYRRLLDRAQFNGLLTRKRLREVFKTLGTADFETAVERLEVAANVLSVYKGSSDTLARIRKDRRIVQRSLARTLADVHPPRIGDVGDARLDRCHDFIRAFDEVYTTNYDLLLYWAVNRKDRAHFVDGFGRRDGRLVHTQPKGQNVAWLHGAVHLYEELVPGGEPLTIKNEWMPGMALIDQLRDGLAVGRFPLIVTEGTWQQKQLKINRSSYLSDALSRLRGLEGSLVTYGWALSENDFHVMTAIARSDIDHLYIGLHGGRHEGSNPDTIGQSHRLRAESGDRVKLHFWDSSTATVW